MNRQLYDTEFLVKVRFREMISTDYGHPCMRYYAITYTIGANAPITHTKYTPFWDSEPPISLAQREKRQNKEIKKFLAMTCMKSLYKYLDKCFPHKPFIATGRTVNTQGGEGI